MARDSKLEVIALLSTRSSQWLRLSLGHDDFSSHLCPQCAYMGKSDIDMKWTLPAHSVIWKELMLTKKLALQRGSMTKLRSGEPQREAGRFAAPLRLKA